MPASWKTVRVFISSTFRDMQAERDQLVRFVFPRLRAELVRRHVHLVDVDLRWGVTSEQDATAVCREVIDECRPRFLCLLGGRYGWIPPGQDHSITADEVHYGVLDRDGPRGQALFYFRDDAATAAMRETMPGDLREPPGGERARKLAELKRAIIAARLAPVTYSARWDDASGRLTGLAAFGERVFADLLTSLRADPDLRDRFEANATSLPDEFAEEKVAMATFMEERSERYVLGSRSPVLETLVAHAVASDDNNLLCLTGAAGCGKSALLAHLCAVLESRADAPRIVSHFVGASAGSSDVRRMLRGLCHGVKPAASADEEAIPEEFDELTRAFPERLAQAGAAGRIVVVIDAINQLDTAAQGTALSWLPGELPSRVRLIVSTLEGAALDALRRRARRPREVALGTLSREDGEAIIGQFLRRYRKNLEPSQCAALLAKRDAATPLYLLAALEELRTLGTFEEITARIDDLPVTARELFAWILERLKRDSGFRDAAGRTIGEDLVSRFAVLMAASRHGLSQLELTGLLDPGDPHGNVAALLHLLRPYLMRRGELLDFHHAQFRAAALASPTRAGWDRTAAHTCLAAYFRSVADPDGQQRWELNARALGELPHHLGQAMRGAELRRLFTSVAYLAARVATGQVFELIADHALLGRPLPAALEPWRAFLQRHAQRLVAHPGMFMALVCHEGFPEAKVQVDGVHWSLPWLRMSMEEMPAGETVVSEGLCLQSDGGVAFHWSRASAIAAARSIAFAFERLGVVRVCDLEAMRETETTLAIGTDRPLVLACAPDASALAVFYETGKAELYRCSTDARGRPVAVERRATFGFVLPETEDPVVAWEGGAFRYQSGTRMLGSISISRPAPVEEPLPAGVEGEVCALLQLGTTRLVALRQGADTVFVAAGCAPLRRRAALLIGACVCGEKSLAVAFTDGMLVVYEVGPGLEARHELRVGMVRGASGWDGSRLLWLDEDSGFRAWKPGDPVAVPLQDNEQVAPRTLHISPRTWIPRSDGSLLLGTSHRIVAVRLQSGSIAGECRAETLLGGSKWRLVRKRGEDQWLAERGCAREVLLGRSVKGRLYPALDGGGRLYAVSGYGPGLVIDPTTQRSTPIRDCPPGVNAALGDAEGGCWLTDRAGDILFIDASGACRRVAAPGLNDVHGSHLEDCGAHLVWWGYSSKHFPETGTEPARTMLFFAKRPGAVPEVELVGRELRHPREGQFVAVCHDRAGGCLVTLWMRPRNGIETYQLRIGEVARFAGWSFEERPVRGLPAFQVTRTSLSANGRLLGVLSMAGEFCCVRIADGCVVASLAGSAPFTDIVPGAEGPTFWLVEARERVLGCVLVEGES